MDYWFSPDYTFREGQRERVLMVGDRPIARVRGGSFEDMSNAGAAGGSVVRGWRWSWQGVQEMALGVWVGLVVLLSALAFRQRRRRVQGVMASLTLSCFAFTALGCGTARQRTEAPATVTYLHQGVSPGPVMITDAEGQVITERRYEPFGSPIDSLGRDGQVVSGTDFHVEPWNSLNKETDPRTGWSYHGARWLSPGTGRWLSPDPPTKAPDAAFLAAPWDLNPYQYVRQNPALYWDPNGEEWTRSEVALAERILVANGVKNPSINETFHQLATSYPQRPEAQAYLQAEGRADFYVQAPWKALEYATYLEGGVVVAQGAKAFINRAAGAVTHASKTVVSWVKGLFSRAASDAAGGALRFGADDLVYGPSARGALRELQQRTGGRLLTDIGGPATGQSWAQFSFQTLERQLVAGGRIRFDLTHIDNLVGVLRGTGPHANTVTAQELRYLQSNWGRFQGNVSFYRGGAEVSVPW